jgi:hypothetical protein
MEISNYTSHLNLVFYPTTYIEQVEPCWMLLVEPWMLDYRPIPGVVNPQDPWLERNTYHSTSGSAKMMVPGPNAGAIVLGLGAWGIMIKSE